MDCMILTITKRHGMEYGNDVWLFKLSFLVRFDNKPYLCKIMEHGLKELTFLPVCIMSDDHQIRK